MANLLANPELWHTGSNPPPPSIWNGSAYAINASSSSSDNFLLAYNGGAQPALGDLIYGSITFECQGGIPPGSTAYLVLFDQLNFQTLAAIPVQYGVASEFSFDAGSFQTPAWGELGFSGVTLGLDVTNGEPSGYPSYLYGLKLTLIPAAEPTPIPVSCDEIGRVTRNYVSAHQRDRVHRASLYAAEKRCLVTDFNGAIPKGRSIASATWQTDDTTQCLMSQPAVLGRQVQVQIAAQYTGHCRIRVDAVLDNGEVYSAWHVIRVQPAPYFNNPGWVTGPRMLMAVAI